MNLLRPIVSIGFAFLVLISSTQFMVGIHRCGGHVRHVAVFDKAEACDMEKQVPPCHRQVATTCCQDITVVHENEDFSIDWNPVAWVAGAQDVVVNTSLILSEVIPASDSPDPMNYSPPLRSTDRTVALHVFLI